MYYFEVILYNNCGHWYLLILCIVLYLTPTTIVGIKILVNNYASSQVCILRLDKTFVLLTLLRNTITLNHNIWQNTGGGDNIPSLPCITATIYTSPYVAKVTTNLNVILGSTQPYCIFITVNTFSPPNTKYSHSVLIQKPLYACILLFVIHNGYYIVGISTCVVCHKTLYVYSNILLK